MAFSKINNVRFAGVASCVPKNKVSNILDCPPSMRAERERLVRNIGIEFRHIAPAWLLFSDMAFEAAETLIEALNWKKEEIDALIVITQSPDYQMPATAIILQDRLNLPKTTIAFDVNLGCSGYPFGLHLVSSLISAGGVRKALILVGDKSAEYKEPLFSDAGTATALEFCENSPPIYFDLNSDGSGYKAIYKPIGGHREPFDVKHLISIKDKHGFNHFPNDLILDGPAVLSFSTQTVPIAIQEILNKSNTNIDEIDYFVLHQANKMINETIRRKLRVAEEKFPSTLKDFGNTSSATLPITMTSKLRTTLENKKNKILLCGFGIGLSWGSCILDIENAIIPEIKKI